MSSSNQVLLDINQDPLLIIERDFKALYSGELVGKRLYAVSGSNLYLSTNAAASFAVLATFDKPIGAISTSESMLLVAAGDKILISKDLGKSFK